MSYPIVHILKHHPFTFAITVNKPSPTVNSIISILTQHGITHSIRQYDTIVLQINDCESPSEEAFEATLQEIVNYDRMTLIIDSADQEYFIVQASDGEICGFPKHPTSTYTKEQTLKIY